MAIFSDTRGEVGVGEGAEVDEEAEIEVMAELGEGEVAYVVLVLGEVDPITTRSSCASSTMIGWCD